MKIEIEPQDKKIFEDLLDRTIPEQTWKLFVEYIESAGYGTLWDEWADMIEEDIEALERKTL